MTSLNIVFSIFIKENKTLNGFKSIFAIVKVALCPTKINNYYTTLSIHIHSLAHVDSSSIKLYEGNVVNILPTSIYLVSGNPYNNISLF